MANELAKTNGAILKYDAPVGNIANFNALLLKDAMQKRLADILKDTKKINQFNNVVLNLVSSNNDLTHCTAASIIYAALRAFELNLNCNSFLHCLFYEKKAEHSCSAFGE